MEYENSSNNYSSTTKYSSIPKYGTVEYWAWLLGWLGGIILLYGYYLVQTNKISASSSKYIILNVIGSGLLLFNVLYHKAYPSVVVNGIWMIIGVWSLYKLHTKT